jgi:hypothetical protein
LRLRRIEFSVHTGRRKCLATRERTLALINAFVDEPQLIRDIATWCITANAYPTMDGDEAEDATYMDALRIEWPEATEEEITLGHNLALAVAEVVKTRSSTQKIEAGITCAERFFSCP